MSLETLTDAERERIISLKLQHAYDRPNADQMMTVSDLVDGEIIERPASFDESWVPVMRRLRDMPSAEEERPAESDQSLGL